MKVIVVTMDPDPNEGADGRGYMWRAKHHEQDAISRGVWLHHPIEAYDYLTDSWYPVTDPPRLRRMFIPSENVSRLLEQETKAEARAREDS